VIWPDLSGDPVKIPREGADHDRSLRAAAVCAAARPARGRGGHTASAGHGRTGDHLTAAASGGHFRHLPAAGDAGRIGIASITDACHALPDAQTR